jgi:hypothetical protein
MRELDTSSEPVGLQAVLENRLKWAGPHQELGIFNRRDLVEMFEDAGAEFAVSLLRRLEADCASQ